MSPLYVDGARAWISCQVHVVGFATSPSMPNVQVSVDKRGVTSAVSTGHSLPASYCPGGRRGSRAAFPRPEKPRVNRPIVPPLLSSLPREREALAQVGHERLGDLERGEVAALVVLAPVDDVRIELTDPLAHRRHDLLRIDREPCRHADGRAAAPPE